MTHDTLSEVLRKVRLKGALFYHVECAEPWVAEQPRASDVVESIMPEVEHLMMYHVLTRGSCWCAVAELPPVRLDPGDVVVIPRGDPHVMSSAPGMRALLDVRADAMPRPDGVPFFLTRSGESVAPGELCRAEGACTTFVCGYFGCDATPFNPLLASLPSLLHVRSQESCGGWIPQFIHFAVDEANRKRPGGEAVLERLSETMFVEVVRRYVDGLSDSDSGWLAGLRDRHVSRALAFMHERPADAWTIQSLAQQVGLSRSALHERFLRFTSVSPMQYLMKWRMQLAATLLRQSQASITSIALEVGYESEAAFSRAFRRATGMPPATWRREGRHARVH